MSIFKTDAPKDVRRRPDDQSCTRWTDKEPAANMKGERMGAADPYRDVRNLPNKNK
jgi:hypothetical protein